MKPKNASRILEAQRATGSEASNPKAQVVFERTEKKYLLEQDVFTDLMEEIVDKIEDDLYPRSYIQSLYYDTPTYDIINRSIERPPYKEKLRVRAYGNPGKHDAVFVEHKKKVDGIVYKRRVTMTPAGAEAFLSGTDYERAQAAHPLPESLAAHALDDKSMQIAREIAACRQRYDQLAPAMMIITHRLSQRTNDGSNLRITFDLDPMWRADNLRFDPNDTGQFIFPDGKIIMEVKSLNVYPMWFVKALNSRGIYPRPCSKYGHAYETLCPVKPAYAPSKIFSTATAYQPISYAKEALYAR